MASYEVKQGETISSIAFQFGFFPDSLWDLPENSALKELRGNGNILMPGDVVAIPALRTAAFEKLTAQRHRFKRLGVPARLRLQFLGHTGVQARQPYVLTIDGRRLEGMTDGEGVLEVFVPPNARSGEVQIGGELYPLQLGTLDPVSELAGVKKRLNNMGFLCGDANTPPDGLLETALRQFQLRMGLPETGVLDETTRRRLLLMHDSPGALPPAATEQF
jgi:hypothetical protein